MDEIIKRANILQNALFDAIKILKRLEHDEWGGLLEVMSNEFEEYKAKYEELIDDGKHMIVISNPGWEGMKE